MDAGKFLFIILPGDLTPQTSTSLDIQFGGRVLGLSVPLQVALKVPISAGADRVGHPLQQLSARTRQAGAAFEGTS